jgi:Na+-driven multidrug efflux pump
VSLTGYWFIGIPLGSYLAFGRDMNLTGVWIGSASAIGFNLFVYLFLLYVYLSWEGQA